MPVLAGPWHSARPFIENTDAANKLTQLPEKLRINGKYRGWSMDGGMQQIINREYSGPVAALIYLAVRGA